MTDKVQKIREKVEMVINRRLNLLNGDHFDLNREVESFTNEIIDIINSLQEEPKIPQVFDEGYWERLGEEPVSKEIGDYDHKAVMESLHPKLKEAPVSKDLEIAANEWDAKASFTPFYMALDGNGNPYEIKQDYTTHAESFKAGAKWQEKQMIAKAIDGVFSFTYDGKTLYGFVIPDSFCDDVVFKNMDKVKLIVIKQED